ncbi:MAG: T9SS type A sorting domain-containing protein [Lewinellaceae bacterium]|nr:T9SS type A sorting domain-containing protein [Lewinellaceae bacterium]
MSKTLTLKHLVFAVLVALGFQTANAQAFWTETFSDQASSTTNWVNGGTNGGAEVWTWTNDPLAGFMNAAIPGLGSPTADSGNFYFNSDANGEFDHDVTLTGVGNPADCSGKSNVHLRFYTQYIHYTAGSIAQVGMSTDGINFTYTTILAALPADAIYDDWVDVDLPGADGQAQVWIQFRWIGNYEYHWKVDDLELYEFVAPTNQVTFSVDMSTQTVDPSGVFISGTFNNWTNEAMTDAGNGIYTSTQTLTQGEQAEYHYKNGATAETGNAECGVSDGMGGYYRTYTPSGDISLPVVCFNSCGGCVVPCDQNPNAIICDNIDSYSTALKLGPQATWWTTWSGTEGTTEDGIVTTEQANTAPNSVKVVSTAAAGGPQDVVLNLGNKTSGRYELKWNLYVPAAKNAYYNIQNVVPIGAGSWNLDVFFSNNNMGNIQIGAGASLAEFSYPSDSWFEVKHIIDLDNNLLTLYINGVFVKKMAYPNNLGGIDFYGTNNVSTFYIDDVSYVTLSPIVYNANLCDAALDLSTLFGQAPGVAQNSGIQDNTNATVSPSDPAIDCWGENPGTDILDNTMWYTFTGDGNRYHIETNDCNGTVTNYIGSQQMDTGDTQMAVFEGDNCSDLTLVECNDDLYTTGTPDWRAGLDIETTNGTTYYILIDGFNTGVAATGEYCVSVTQSPSIDCADGAVGTFTLDNNGFICFGGNLNTVMMPDAASFIMPNLGPVYGMLWCITTDPVPANAWPGTIPGIASTAFSPTVTIVNLPNDGTGFAPGQYYLTPVVVAGGALIDPAGLARIFNVDPSGGCYFVGASQAVTLLPQINDLAALGQTTNEVVPPGNNGAISLAVEGGIAEVLGDPSLYGFEWSNGAFTQNLTGLTAGTYTVTISDPTGCVSPFTASFTVGLTTGTKDPAAVQSLTVTPNPTSSDAVVRLQLDNAMDVRIDVVNTLGQTVQSFNAGNVKSLNQPLNLSNFAEGAYFMRVTVGAETAVRRIVVQR